MHYDIIIIGGGLVGRSLAYALHEAPINIALIDASAQDQADPRLIALNYGSFSFLRKLGLWPRLEKYSAPIQKVHASYRGRFGATRLGAQDIQLPALGYVVPAHRINQALIEAMRDSKQTVTELRPARVKALELHEHTSHLTIEHSQGSSRISGHLILAADGTESTVRQLLNFETQTLDYQQSAIVTTSQLGRSHNQIAYERFLQDGALAMLPLQTEQGHACATIWTASNTAITHLQALDDQSFMRELQTQFGYRLGRLLNITQRHTFPLRFIQVKNPLQGNVLLIGNAAHTIHPLAAQGLNLALYEIAHLSQTLLDNLRHNQSLNQGLEQKLITFQPKMNLLFSHYLVELFTSRVFGIDLARQLGMAGLDLCPSVKKHLSRLLAMEKMSWLSS